MTSASSSTTTSMTVALPPLTEPITDEESRLNPVWGQFFANLKTSVNAQSSSGSSSTGSIIVIVNDVTTYTSFNDSADDSGTLRASDVPLGFFDPLSQDEPLASSGVVIEQFFLDESSGGSPGIALDSIWTEDSSSGASGPTYGAGANITIISDVIAFNPSGLPVPFTIYVPGTLQAGQILWSAKFPFSLSNNGSLSSWQIESIGTTANASSTLTLSAGGTAVATANFPAASAQGTWSSTSGSFTVGAGSRLQLVGANPSDLTLGNIEITLLFTRT